jgi:hypothetical protein
VFINAVLGYRRPAACNTKLRGLLIVIYNVGYCFRVHSMLPNMEINEK